MAECGPGLSDMTETTWVLTDSSTSSGDQTSPLSQDKSFAIPTDAVAYNQLREHKVRLSSVYSNQTRYLLHHIATEVLDTNKLKILEKKQQKTWYILSLNQHLICNICQQNRYFQTHKLITSPLSGHLTSNSISHSGD